MTIYLDNMAATPVDPRVAEHHCAAMTQLGANAHSIVHKPGAEVQASVDRAAAAVLRTVGSPWEDLTFTPGASAALWLAVEDAALRTRDRPARVAATSVEHPALLAALRRAERHGRLVLTLIPVDAMAAPRLDVMEEVLAGGVDLLCTMLANNEVGTITDMAPVAALAAHYGARHLVDASQAAGRIDISDSAGADLLIVSGAKAYGPRRAGALIGSLTHQAQGMAHDVFGSPDAPSAQALAYALELRAVERGEDEERIGRLRDRLQAHLVSEIPDLRFNGNVALRLAGSLHVSTPNFPGEAVVARLWGRVAVSTGAACQSGVPGPSHVLAAMDIPNWAREGSVRVGIGRFNTEEEIDQAGDLIASALKSAEPLRMRA